MAILAAKMKPRRCPNCGASPLADVHYGMPVMTDDLQDKIDRGLVVLAGCIVTDQDPSWQCTECDVQIVKSPTH